MGVGFGTFEALVLIAAGPKLNFGTVDAVVVDDATVDMVVAVDADVDVGLDVDVVVFKVDVLLVAFTSSKSDR